MLELLTFSQFVVQLFKNEDTLAQNEFNINLKPNNDNLYKDELIINQNINFTNFYFKTNSFLWDNFKQFSVYSNSNYQSFTFRINSLTGIPESYLCDDHMNHQMVLFANDIFHIIQVIDEQLTQDHSILYSDYHNNIIDSEDYVTSMKF